jgi:hypothetical protein
MRITMRRTGILLMVILLNIAVASAETYNDNDIGKARTAYAYIDKSPPDSYIESMYGWYNHDVMARIKARDALSGVHTISWMIDGSSPFVSYSSVAEFNLSEEGVHQIEYSSMDSAGNVEEIKTSLVKLDLTVPVISIISPLPGGYLHSDIITLDFSGTDTLSGIFSLNAKINNIPVMASQEFDMLSLSPGFHEFEALTLDNAGNSNVSKVNFTVISNIDSLTALNDRAVRNGWITSEGTAGVLTQKLALARKMIEEGQKERANDMIKSYMNEIEIQRGKTITGYGADILTTEAAYVYIFLFSPS